MTEPHWRPIRLGVQHLLLRIFHLGVSNDNSHPEASRRQICSHKYYGLGHGKAYIRTESLYSAIGVEGSGAVS
jgi:hypothetical protein